MEHRLIEDPGRPRGVVAVVVQLTEAVASHYPPSTPLERLLVEVMRLLPLYAELRRVDLWDDAHRELLIEPSTPLETLLVAIDDFAGFNLYSGFEIDKTQHNLREVLDLLTRHGIRPQVDTGVEGW